MRLRGVPPSRAREHPPRERRRVLPARASSRKILARPRVAPRASPRAAFRPPTPPSRPLRPPLAENNGADVRIFRDGEAQAWDDEHAPPSTTTTETTTTTTTTTAAPAGPTKTSSDKPTVTGRPEEQFSDAAASERQTLFNDIAPVYDQLNDLLSLGLHRVWKRAAVKWTGVRPGDRAIDVCCGSGDVALRLADAVGPSGEVVGLDFAAAQLRVAAEKEAAHPTGYALSPIVWQQGDALALPHPDGAFDGATIGYGLRNVSDVPLALSELCRVLKPGGKAAVLDFNNAVDPNLNFAQGFVLDNVVVPVAELNGVAAEYRYLRPSIERYPKGPELVQLAVDAGFSSATFYELEPARLMGCLVCVK